MSIVFSNPPRKGKPAKIWHLDEVLELAKDLPVYQQKLSELDSLDVVAWYGNGFHYGRLTVREIAKHSQRIYKARRCF